LSLLPLKNEQLPLDKEEMALLVVKSRPIINLKGLDVVLVHELRSLVQFYRVTLIPSLIPADCALAAALVAVQNQFRALFDALVENAATDARAVHSVQPDLSAPSQLIRGAHYISRIADTLETSLLAPQERTPALLIQPLLAPLQEMTKRLAGQMEAELGAVFTVNCLSVLRDALLPYNFATVYVQQLVEQIRSAESNISEDMKQRVKG